MDRASLYYYVGGKEELFHEVVGGAVAANADAAEAIRQGPGTAPEKLRTLEISHDRHTVYVKPELVVEIAFNEVQESPHYPGGLALRFARVKGYRQDKSANDADTIDAVRDIYLRSLGDAR